MTVLLESGYAVPSGDEPLTHARIAHSNNWHEGGTVSASTTDSAFFEDAPTTTLTYEKWKPTALAATWAYTHGSAVECDYCCIAAHNMGTQQNDLQVQYYDGGWVDLIAATSITSDEPIMAIFDPVTASQWRIRITQNSLPSIGVVKFGKALQMERPLFGGHSPVNFARQTILRSNYSETGQFLGRTKLRTYLNTDYEWSNLSTTFIRNNWKSLQTAIETEPFFIAWRPGDNGDVAFGQVDEVPVPSNSGKRDLMNVSFSMRALGYD